MIRVRPRELAQRLEADTRDAARDPRGGNRPSVFWMCPRHSGRMPGARRAYRCAT